jgi:hypothetical protein
MTMTTSTSGSSAASAPKISAVGGRPPMGQVIRAVILKELRQNWVNLALVICLEFIIVCVAEWFRSGWLFNSLSENQIHNVLWLPAVQSAITLGCAVAGLLLGLLQPLADRNFDLWAFLTHRPVPRWWLYCGRALAGMILYGLAAGLPVAFALAIAPTRWGGRFFLWEYILPPIADWVAGIAYYFAGLLIMERQARWYGSRVVPIVAVLAGSAAGMYVYSFWTAVLISAVLIVLYITASMGSAVSHGYALRAPRLAKLALTFSLLIGFTLILLAPTTLGLSNVLGRRSSVFSAMNDGRRGEDLWTHDHHSTTGHYQELTPDATIAQVTWDSKWNEKKHEWVQSTTWTDLQGNPLATPTDSDIAGTWSRTYNVMRGNWRDYPVGFRDYGYRVSTHAGPIWNTKFENEWFWVPDRRIFYVYKQFDWEAYSFDDERRRKAGMDAQYLGTFGVNGLDPMGTATPFDTPRVIEPFGDGLMIQTPHILYRLDLEHLTLKPFFAAGADETILGESLDNPQNSSVPQTKMNLILNTNKRVMALTHAGKVVWSLPFSRSSEDFSISVHSFPKVRKLVLEYIPLNRTKDGTDPYGDRTFEFYDDAGKLLNVQTISGSHEPVPSFEPTLLPRGVRQLQRADYRAGAIAAAGNPLAVVGTYFFWRQMPWSFRLRYNDQEANGFREYGLGWRFLATAAPIIFGYAIGAWVLAWVYARSMAARWRWAALACIFGPAALLTFMAANRLPRWVRCPQCGRLRLRKEEHCGKCGKPWSKPLPMGTEIWGADN